MPVWRCWRGLAGLLSVLLILASPAGASGQSWTDTLRIQPITAPIDLRYRPVTDVSFIFGRVATANRGINVPHPVERSVGKMRVERAGSGLAVTFEFDGSKVVPRGSVETLTLRMLISEKGELLDLVSLSDGGEPFAVDSSPLLAEIEQSLYLMLPRFPDRPVRTGDVLYEYELDAGPVPGVLPVRVRGTVRGTTTYNGRAAVVVDYRSSGKAEFNVDLAYSEQGYELIDLATGLVVSLAGTESYDSVDRSIQWTYGFEAVFR